MCNRGMCTLYVSNHIIFAFQSLEDFEAESLKCLPILLNRLLVLLTQTYDSVEEIKLDIIK